MSKNILLKVLYVLSLLVTAWGHVFLALLGADVILTD